MLDHKVNQESGRPRWDEDRRTLYFDEKAIKQFRRPAPSQQLILAAFQEEGWPTRIDDPLIPKKGMSESQAKDRLRSAVADLNRAQHNSILIRFHTDGTGRGILWSVLRQVRSSDDRAMNIT